MALVSCLPVMSERDFKAELLTVSFEMISGVYRIDQTGLWSG